MDEKTPRRILAGKKGSLTSLIEGGVADEGNTIGIQSRTDHGFDVRREPLSVWG